jgi:dihydroflavonol-4-reductase
MNVLVTGATGFIGANIVRQLLKSGHKVRVLVREKSNQRNIRGLNLDVVYGNLLDRKSLESALEGCDGLIHSAAYYTFW